MAGETTNVETNTIFTRVRFSAPQLIDHDLVELIARMDAMRRLYDSSGIARGADTFSNRTYPAMALAAIGGGACGFVALRTAFAAIH